MGLAGGWPGSAEAALELRSLGVTPSVITFPNPGTVTYRVTATATGQDETFALQVRAPWFGPRGVPSLLAGASLWPDDVRVGAPGRLLGPSSELSGTFMCAPVVPAHGAEESETSNDVVIPAGTTATIELEFRVSEWAPWPSTSYDLAVTADPKLSLGKGRGTLARPQSVLVTGPRRRGLRGIELRLEREPDGPRIGKTDVVRVRRGSDVTLTGTTNPRQVRKRVGFWVLRGAERRFRYVKTATTDARGRFRTTLKISGYTQVMARIAAQPPRFAADNSCPLAFDV